jgi:hypothetical protein
MYSKPSSSIDPLKRFSFDALSHICGPYCFVLCTEGANLLCCDSPKRRYLSLNCWASDPRTWVENIKCRLMPVRWYFWTSKRKTARSVTDDMEENKPSAVSMRTCEVKVTLKRLQEDIKCFVVRSRSVQMFKLLISIKITWWQNTAIERTAGWDGRIVLKPILKKWCVDWIGLDWTGLDSCDWSKSLRGYLWIQE